MSLTSMEVSTFARHMICPERVRNKSSANLSSLGLQDYESYPYKHLSNHYSADSLPTTDTLIEKIKDTLKVVIELGKKPLLLLSDGKDSMSLAIAFQELGVSVTTLTFLRKDDLELREYIKISAEEMGHTPFFLDVNDILSAFDENYFVNASKHLTYPVMDQALLFFVFGIKKFFEDHSKRATEYVIIDGMGNDETFGHLPTAQQLKSFKLSKAKLWRLIPHSYGSFRWYIRSPFESHGGLSALSYFFPIPKAYDLNKYFSFFNASLLPLKFVDFRAFSRGQYIDRQCMMGKTMVAARAAGSDVYFPWATENLSHYVFNLPIVSKFCFESLTNKILLRDLLKEKINWEQKKRGMDLYFDINPEDFSNGVISKIIPDKLVLAIDKKLAPRAVKQRAYLELLNLIAYCKSRDWNENIMNEILYGN